MTMMAGSGTKFVKMSAAEMDNYLKNQPIRDDFESKGTIQSSFSVRGLSETVCYESSPCCIIVIRYARMGLHRYNLLQGTNFKLHRVNKYNETTVCPVCSYFITLEAMDPNTSSLQTFQVRVNMHAIGKFILTCNISRIRGVTETTIPLPHYTYFSKESLPELPLEDPFQNNKLFYVLKDSELQDNDWVSLYLDLVVALSRRKNPDPDLSRLEILKVAMEPPNEGLNAIPATFYIRYKDYCEARVGKDVDRIAVVRRTFDEHFGSLMLVGQNQTSKVVP